MKPTHALLSGPLHFQSAPVDPRSGAHNCHRAASADTPTLRVDAARGRRTGHPGALPRTLLASTLAVALFFAMAAPSAWAAFPPPPPPAKVIVSTESLVSLPTSAIWDKHVNIRPGNNEVVTLNPPRFSWPYYFPQNNTSDITAKTFQFQASYDPGFSSLIFNVTTLSDSYNFLAPFNAGSTVYWRVAYIVDGTTNLWITNSFTIGAGAQVWDRHYLADTNYLAQKLVHPFFMLNPGNRTAMYQFLLANQPAELNYVLSNASNAIVQPWWPSTIPNLNVLPDTSWMWDIASVAMAWQLTRNPMWSNSNPQAALVTAANWFITNGGPTSDFIEDADYQYDFNFMAESYDWLYELMTTNQIQTVLSAFEQRSAKVLYGTFAFYNQANGATPLNPYPQPYTVQWGSLFNVSSSHAEDDFDYSMVGAFVACNDGTNCNLLYNIGLNWLIGVSSAGAAVYSEDGQGMGRGYAGDNLFQHGPNLYVNMVAQTIFPEVQFNQNPFWSGVLDFYDRWEPVGFVENHEPWGEGGFGVEMDWRANVLGRDLSWFMESGVAYQHWQAEVAVTRLPDTTPDYTMYLPMFYYYTNPAPIIDPDGVGKLYVKSGWMISSTYGANTTNNFYNGVGVMTQARPGGSDSGHSNMSDLWYQIWAYGASVTDAGAGLDYWDHVAYNGQSLLFNGIGQIQPEGNPVMPVYAQFIAFEDQPSYTYCAADATSAYPINSLLCANNCTPQQSVITANAPLAALQKVQRHLLFMRRKYVVIYDETASSKPFTNSWTYGVMENTLNLNPTNCTFTYTCSNQSGLNVNVSVAHIANVTNMNVIDLQGTNICQNPFTGEDYWTQGGAGNTPRAHSLWFNSTTAVTNFRYLVVIYPTPPGVPLPQITRLDDFTVAVTNGSDGDVISFNPTNTAATFVVNVPAITTNVYPLYVPPGSVTGGTGGSVGGGGGGGGGGTTASAPALSYPQNFHFVNAAGSGTTPAGYSPATDPSVIEWLAADTMSPSMSDGTPVGTWYARIGPNMVQSQVANMPIWKANIQKGLPVVRFDGATSYMTNDEPFSSPTNGDVSNSQPLTIVLAFRDTSTNNYQWILDSFPITGNASVQRWTVFTIWAGASQRAGVAATADSQWHIWMNVFNGSSSKFKFDSGPVTSYPSTPGSGSPFSKFVLGCDTGPAFFTGMDVGEIIAWTGDQSTNATAIFNYLNARWKAY